MPYFLSEHNLEVGNKGSLCGEEARHVIHSRRMKRGEAFEIQDPRGLRFEVCFEEASRKEVWFTVNKQVTTPPAPSLELHVIQALTKEKAVDWIIQKATELGVQELSFFAGKHSPKQIHAALEPKALSRWNRIAQEACKQSGRTEPPKIHWAPELGALLQTLPQPANQWALDLEEGQTTELSLQQRLTQHVSEPFNLHQVVIGPEGGLHTSELELLQENAFHIVPVGPRILRAETAVLAFTCCLQLLYGDF